MAVPTLMGQFIRRSPRWAAIVTVCVTLIPSALGFWGSTLFEEAWSFQQKVLANLAVGFVVYLITTLFWDREKPEYVVQVQRFFDRMTTPVDFAKEVGAGNDLTQRKVIGSFAAVIGFLICMLVLLPNPVNGRLGILFVGRFVATGGILRRTVGAKSR